MPDPVPFAGKYRDPRTHIVYSFTASKGNLMAWGETLRRLGPNQFRDLGSGIMTFDNTQGRMKVSLEYLGENFFSGSRIEELRFGDSALAEFVGLYKSVELNTTYTLSVDKVSLTLSNNWNPPLKMVQLAQDEFESDLGTFVFHRDPKRRVSSVSVFSGGVRNLSFDKAN